MVYQDLPDDSDFGPADLLLSFVDICDALAEVEAFGKLDHLQVTCSCLSNLLGGCGVIDAFDLDQACLGVGYMSSLACCLVRGSARQS